MVEPAKIVVEPVQTLARRGALDGRFAAVADLAPDGGLTLAELTPPAQVTLRGRLADPVFARAVGAALGLVLPGEANTVRTAEGVSVLWLGPSEWLVAAEAGVEGGLVRTLSGALQGAHAAVVDVSGQRARLRLAGPQALDLLAKGMTLDLDAHAFPTGRCAQTLLAKAGVLIHRLDDRPTFDLYVRRSFADYLARWLLDAGAEHGLTAG